MTRMIQRLRLAAGGLLMAGLVACGGGGGGSTPESAAQPAQTGQAVDLSTTNIFPLHQGDAWVYDVTESESTTTSAITRTVITGPDAVGEATLREVDQDTINDTVYRVSAGGVSLLDPFGGEDMFPGMKTALPSFMAYPASSYTVGVPRTANAAGSLGRDWDNDGLDDNFEGSVTQTFRGMETIDVLGTARQVAHFTEVTVVTLTSSAIKDPNTGALQTITVTFTEENYFAPDIGLVRARRSAERADGYGVWAPSTLNLRAATVGGVSYATATAGLDRDSIQVVASRFSKSAGALETVKVSTVDATNKPLYVMESHTNNGIDSVQLSRISASETDVLVQYAAPASKYEGTLNDTITLKVCYDSACKAEVKNSPIKIQSSYLVTSDPVEEVGVAALSVLRRTGLTHNVVDARYSQALNAIVMVSSWPANALYVYDTATRTEKTLALNKLPVALTLSPNGKEAAVGHDALVTWVDLTTLSADASPNVKLLNLSTKAFDLVLDGYRHVHVTPAADQWVSLHSIDVDTNTESLVGWLLYAGAHAKLNTAVSAIYTSDNGLSPSDITRWNLDKGTASYVGDSRYHGDYAMCGNLWMSDDGDTIYTACGNAFKASATAAQDMLYTGALPLSNGTYGWKIMSLSQTSAINEIALIEADNYQCLIIPTAACYNHLNLYTSDFMQLKNKFSLAPLAVAGRSYGQRGTAVFHGADGAGLFLISRLEGVPDPASEFYISVIR